MFHFSAIAWQAILQKQNDDMETLRDVWRTRRCTNDELWTYAEICRVANVMRPYMEVIG